MKKNGMGGRLFAYTLIAAMMLTMQEVPVLAETMHPESQPEISETEQEGQSEASEQSEGQPEASEQQEGQPEVSEQQENPPEVSVEQPDAEIRTLPDDVLAECIVPGVNPQGVIVNLFDYWQTGDDSMIWWWTALCIVSLLGIGATVCNLKQKNKQIWPVCQWETATTTNRPLSA